MLDTVVLGRLKMSITLIRVKGGDAEKDVEERNDLEVPISLPAVLGRGSLLKCAEKKVSRRHAYLDWDDDGVLITSVHQNPTYIVVNGLEKELTEGDSTLLSHGDKFGLMKSTFWFKIHMPGIGPKDKEEAKVEEFSHFENTSKEPTKQLKAKENGTDDSKAVWKRENVSDHSNEKNVKPHIENVTEAEEVPDDQEKIRHSDVAEWQRDDDELGKIEIPKKQCDDSDINSCDENYITSAKVTEQEFQLAVSTRKRDLPEWVFSSDVPKVKGSPAETSKLHSHGSSRKTLSATSKRKRAGKSADNSSSASTQANEETSDTHHSSINPVVNAYPAKTKYTESPRKQEKVNSGCGTSKRINQNSSPRKARGLAKKGTSPLKKEAKLHHNISDESSDEDLQSSTTSDQKNESDNGNVDRPNQTPLRLQHSTAQQHLPLSRHHDLSEDDEEDITDETTNSTVSGNTNTPLPSSKREAPSAVPQRKAPRKSCQFGAKCYRKKPQHRLDFAHFGDTDYKENSSEPEDLTDERPECEYGINCYRKNPEHRRNYRHSRVPQPQRKAKRKAGRQKQEAESDSDDYDYDDSFLNDDSSDDYAPTDSGSDSAIEGVPEEEEDTTRLLKEAKKFVRKKKVYR